MLQPFAAHAHGHYVIGRVIEGERSLGCNGRSFPLSPGDVLALNPGDVHGCEVVGETPFAYDSITVPKALLDGVRLAGPVIRSEGAAERFSAIIDGINDGDGDGILEAVLLFAEEHRDGSSPVADPPSCHGESALRVRDHLREHLADPQGLRALAAGEGLSVYALIRAYRRRFSITPLQHLLSLRVERACELLAQGAAPSEAAERTGFSDQAHLTRAFKQRMGTTPAAYGKMAAKRGGL